MSALRARSCAAGSMKSLATSAIAASVAIPLRARMGRAHATGPKRMLLALERPGWMEKASRLVFLLVC